VILAFFPRKPDNGHGEDEDDLEGVQL